MFEIYRECTFAASHQLMHYKGKCERLHGHNWRVGVHLEGPELDRSGMLFDFHELDALLRNVIEAFDHRHLNEVSLFDGHSPSSEQLARVVALEVQRALPVDRSVVVTCCDVWENDHSRARYRPGPRDI